MLMMIAPDRHVVLIISSRRHHAEIPPPRWSLRWYVEYPFLGDHPAGLDQLKRVSGDFRRLASDLAAQAAIAISPQHVRIARVLDALLMAPMVLARDARPVAALVFNIRGVLPLVATLVLGNISCVPL